MSHLFNQYHLKTKKKSQFLFAFYILIFDRVVCWLNVQACFKTSAKLVCLLKFHDELSLLNIVVSYQSLHFVHTVLIYEMLNNDCRLLPMCSDT